MTKWGVTAELALGLEGDAPHTNLSTLFLYLHSGKDVLPIELALTTLGGENCQLTLPINGKGIMP